MDFKLDSLEPSDRYKLLNGIVIPRPIAWITSVDEKGTVNAAPFSYFNIMGIDPPIVTVGPQFRVGFREGVKDTPRNIRSNGSFVINIVNEELVEKMHNTSAFYPAEVSEAEDQDLVLAPSVSINVPRIARAPASIECREHTTMFIGNTRIVIGEALHLWIRDELVDTERFHVNMEAMHAVGRMGGGRYTRTGDMFDLNKS